MILITRVLQNTYSVYMLLDTISAQTVQHHGTSVRLVSLSYSHTVVSSSHDNIPINKHTCTVIIPAVDPSGPGASAPHHLIRPRSSTDHVKKDNRRHWINPISIDYIFGNI